ncbi:MAG: hypothetical protein C0402_02030 [Thermodesulfovibrio sp.]|nr:hypothetical protein [Thermodesulfovibrio sp.]
MKKTLILFTVFLLSGFLLGAAAMVDAAEEIGKIVALKGKALTERNNTLFETKLKDGIQLIDIVATKEASRTKMLFLDDSVLTIGENTRLVVKEFVLRKDDRGRAIFNLLDGKMRAVVGRSDFEVRTPTLVAAARGTVIYFETGERDGKKYTSVISLEGMVDIRSIDPTVTGTVVLTPGMMVTARQGEALPTPVPAPREAVHASGMTKQPRPSLLAATKPALAIADTLRTTALAPKIERLPVTVPVKNPIAVGIVFP